MRLGSLLLGAAAAFLLLDAHASAQTRFEIVDECKRRITVPIEIYTIPTDGTSNPNRRHGRFVDGNGRDVTSAGDGATEDYAAEMTRQIESIWNGVSAQEAETVASLVNASTRLQNWQERTAVRANPETGVAEVRIDPATGQPVDIASENALVAVDNAEEDIREYWAAYESEFGLNCAYIPCCEIEVVADVQVRDFNDEPRPGYC